MVNISLSQKMCLINCQINRSNILALQVINYKGGSVNLRFLEGFFLMNKKSL